MAQEAQARAFVEACCGRMVGQELWRARIGVGSTMFLDIGPSHTDQSGWHWGDVHLGIYDAIWELRFHDQIVAHCEDDHDTMQSAVDHLAGTTVTACTYHKPDGITLIVDTGHTLVAQGRRDPDSEDWNLFADGLVASTTAGEPTIGPSGDEAIDGRLQC